MKIQTPLTEFTLWRSEQLFNIDFALYTLSHHHFPRHFHDHYVIELVLEGADSFYCDGKNYTAYSNQLVLINPGEVHTGSTVNDIPLRYFSFYPDQKAMQQVAEAMDISLPDGLHFRKTLPRLPSLNARLTRLFYSLRSNHDSLHQQEIFFDCMHGLLQQQPPKEEAVSNSRDPRINLLIDFIRSRFKEDISLKKMAELVSISPFHLVRLFKRHTGISPYEYLLVIRTEFAKKMLRKGYKVQDAAREAGFYDTSHFSRSLRKMTTTSPRSFLSSRKAILYNF